MKSPRPKIRKFKTTVPNGLFENATPEIILSYYRRSKYYKIINCKIKEEFIYTVYYFTVEKLQNLKSYAVK